MLGGVQVASHGTPHSHDLTNCVRVRQDGKRSEATVVAGVHEADQRYPRKAHASTHKHESCGGGGGDEQRAKRRP